MHWILPVLVLVLCMPACTVAHKSDISPDQVSPKEATAPTVSATEPVRSLELQHIKRLRGANIMSPKSVIFSADGSRFYINSLEGLKTVVYDSTTLEQIAVIKHEFDHSNSELFVDGEKTLFDYEYYTRRPVEDLNCFDGKPVECVLTHAGRYLWVTYYRRTWDKYATSPSAVAIIDTQSNQIVRVMPTGPLPKMIVASPDNKTLAIVHWGDNSIALVDISSDSPQDFHFKELLIDGKRLNVQGMVGDRDKLCGHCLRGATFSQDSRYLFVARMRGGGITVFDLETKTHLGTFTNVAPTPRHLILSKDGTKLYVSSNVSGRVSELLVDEIIRSVKGERKDYNGRSLFVGKQARTVSESPDGRVLFVACNIPHELVAVDIVTWKKIEAVKTFPYTVGLAINPQGTLVVTTSQGRKGQGGHAVDVFAISPALGSAFTPNTIPAQTEPQTIFPSATQAPTSDNDQKNRTSAHDIMVPNVNASEQSQQEVTRDNTLTPGTADPIQTMPALDAEQEESS